MKRFDEIIAAYGLGDHYRWFCLHNSSTAPYHSVYHANCMIENCYDGAQYYNLPYSSTRELLIAAMFHDFNHSGGKLEDRGNINRALKGVSTFFAQYCKGDGGVSNLIWQCIKCTEYPFVIEPFTIEQRIIRDADLMQYRYPDWLEMYETNLKKEIEVRLDKEVSHSDMYWGNVRFWKSVEYFTEWGEKVHREEGVDLSRHYYLNDYEL